MIELPRACLTAGAIAAHADFFSFGTNDLTQTGLGFSRDDIEGRIMPLYANYGIVERSPFGTLDQAGVGELVEIALERGRAAKPGLQVGVCGEHGGDPSSIRFFHAPGSTTSAAPRSACRWRASRRRRPRWRSADAGGAPPNEFRPSRP